jgi:hypothetical protein
VSWREFVASLVGALAWPLAVVVVLALFRRQVAELLEAPLSRLKAGPLEFAWDRAVGALGASVVAASAPPTAGEGADVEPDGQLADRTPVAAILTSFRDVEREVRALARQAAVADADELSVDSLTDLLVTRGLVGAQTASAVRGLVVLRDLALHGRGDENLNAARASEFTLMARGVLYALRTPPLRPRGGPAGLAGQAGR